MSDNVRHDPCSRLSRRRVGPKYHSVSHREGAAVKQAPARNKQTFVTDVKTLRKRARQHIEEGAVTAGYGGDTATAVKGLNDALPTEIVCVLRYKRHYFIAQGIHAWPVPAE